MSTNHMIADVMAKSGVAFGTSGARGKVIQMTDAVCFIYVAGFLQYLRNVGEFAEGSNVFLAGDLRPSTPRILAACAEAVRYLGGVPLFAGYVPTPALALAAFKMNIPSVMVTGSHIPDDRNGIKFYRCQGEVLKEDEAGIRQQIVAVPDGLFDSDGAIQQGLPLPNVTDVETDYIARYTDCFGPDALAGLRIGVFQHSAVGRDLLVNLINALGGEAVPIGRSEIFVPVDTEAVRQEDILAARAWSREYGFDAIISTDGDSDRPLLADEQGEWLRGDRLGILCAQALSADFIVTPVSSNTAAELSGSFGGVVRTRIGSPFVIAAMNEAVASGGKRVCGYEANGGFLTASDIAVGDTILSALPTRDAVLPILSVLVASKKVGGIAALEKQLPNRVTYSDRIENFPTTQSAALFAFLAEGAEAEQDERLGEHFGSPHGGLATVDRTDGIRMTMRDGQIVHLRGSGNAPELRCYTEADEQEAAEKSNKVALSEVMDIVGALSARTNESTS